MRGRRGVSDKFFGRRVDFASGEVGERIDETKANSRRPGAMKVTLVRSTPVSPLALTSSLPELATAASLWPGWQCW
jgi:hypothetical protein